MENKHQIEIITEELLETLVTLEKLKLVRKDLLKEAAVFVIIAVIVAFFGWFARFKEWTAFPVFQGGIFVFGILLAVGLRPLQQYKKEVSTAEAERATLEVVLEENNLIYDVDVRVTRDDAGEFDIKKRINIVSNKN